MSEASTGAWNLYERAAALVEQLFEAPSDPKSWQRVLASLSETISEDSVSFVIGPPSRDGQIMVLGHGLDPTPISADDLLPWSDLRSLREVQAGTVFPIARPCPSLASTVFHQKVLQPLGIAPGPGFCVVLGRDAERLIGFVLVLSRKPDWVPRTKDRALLELLAPYFIRAVAVGLHLNQHRSSIEALIGIFDALVLGVVLLDAHAEVSFANRSAAEMLGVSAGLSGTGPSAAAETKRRTAALRALLRSESGTADAALSYPHPVDGRPLHIVSTPLRRTGAGSLPDERFASAIFLGDPGIGVAGTERALADLYDLTPSEERLALRLAAGDTLAEAAARLGIRLSTARGVLRSVFEKTGTHRQPNLVRLLLTLPGQVRVPAPRG